jgi:Bacterial PH domain
MQGNADMPFKPPPNWPTPPPEWTPPPGWQPDPAWGPVPPGWAFYPDEDDDPVEATDDELVAKGYNGEMALDERARTVTISRDGKMARLGATGHNSGARVIPLDAVSGVRIRPATRMVNGCLGLGVGGADVLDIGVAQMNGNRDAVVFRFGQREAFIALHGRLEGVVQDNRARGVDAAATGVEATRKLSPKNQIRSQERLAQRLEKAQQDYGAYGTRPDIATAAARMSWTFGGKRELKKLHEHVYPDEVVTYIAQGTYQEHQGIVVLTDQRLVFVFHGMVQTLIEDFPLRSITSVASKKGLVTGALIVHVAGSASHISAVINSDLTYLVDHLRQTVLAGPVQNIAASSPPPPVADLADQLIKLADLRERGILTDVEFATQEAKLLAR